MLDVEFCNQCSNMPATIIKTQVRQLIPLKIIWISLNICICYAARKKSSQQQTPSKRFWTDSASSPIMNPALIDPNIENISVNVNRAESDRLSVHKLAESYFSSDESNDSLVIDHDP